MSEYERASRRQRLNALREAGIDPYPARIGPRSSLAEVRAAHDGTDAEALERNPVTVAVAGRVMAFRSFGKLVFLDLLEGGATLQVSGRKTELDPEVFERLTAFDVGDFVRVEGVLWRTRTGELTVKARSAELLAKSLRPLPEKWHGLTDVETRYRQRYLDLLSNPPVREIAIARSRILSVIRAFLDARGFLEVETPILQQLYGGAAAQPFTTHHNLFDQDLYLRISDELYLKRLVVGGLDRVYEIGHNFRNEGISRIHSPEFTMLECYQAYADYHDMMGLTEELLREVAIRVFGGTRFSWEGHELDFAAPWPRRRMRDAVLEATEGLLDITDVGDFRERHAALVAAGHRIEARPTAAQLIDEVFSELVEPGLIQPTFIVDYPVELSPLAKRSPDNPGLVERFELFVGGFELANAFSELNDPDDQRVRFEQQRGAAAAGDAEAQPYDEDFLRALEHGMPPTGGLGIGIDRLVLVLTGAPNLREVVLFPHLRPERS